MGSTHICVVVLSLCLLANLTNGQVGQCTGMGCRCSDPYDCCLQVEENVNIGTFVGFASINSALSNAFMSAADSSYGIANEEILFDIDPMNASITTLSSIDRESSPPGDCVVIVAAVQTSSNNVAGKFAINIVDKNDNAPMFSADTVSISLPETTDSQTQIDCDNTQTRQTLNSLMATDADHGNNSIVRYSIPDSIIFTIPEPTTTLCIMNTIDLDRDDPNYEPYSFTLVATDEGSEPLTSNITVNLALTPENEFSPVFSSPSEFEVREDRSPRYIIHQFNATDRDIDEDGSPQQVQYGLNPNLGPFEINEESGELCLTNMVKAGDLYELTVTATDMMKIGMIDVTVRVTDVNEPATITRVSVTSITVEENSILSVDLSPLITVDDDDIDPRNQNNSLQIISGEEYFTVEPIRFGGLSFQIEQVKPIDRENVSSFNLSLQLIEGGDPLFDNQTITIPVTVLDVNDNAPTLNVTSFNYVETGTGFDSIVSLSKYIIDPDEGTNSDISSILLISANSVNDDGTVKPLTDKFVQYQQPQGNELGSNGILQAPPIDREVDGDVITIIINITDNGVPPMTRTEQFTVDIFDINDNRPTFESNDYTFSIRENLDIDTVVDSVRANDQDKNENGTVIYSLDMRGDYRFFTIDSHTGSIRSRVSFDREHTSQYVIYANARDNALQPLFATSMATVTILIEDENDNTPIFDQMGPIEFVLETNAPVNELVGRVGATDPDEGPNGDVLFRLEPISMFFEINNIGNNMGEIRLKESTSVESIFNLTVIAYNNNSREETAIDISITVTTQTLDQMQITIIAGTSGLVLLLLLLVSLVLICCCCRRNRRGNYEVKDHLAHLNNHPERVNSITKPILKSVPAAANGGANKGRTQVQFSDLVDETHYDRQQAVNGDTILRKASIRISDESPQVTNRGPPIHNGNLPSTTLPVIELEMSPGQHINGDLTGIHSRYEMHHLPQHSPIHLRQDMPDHPALTEFSQGTSSTTDEVNSYNSEGEEESTFSDVASNMNTSIPRFQTDDHPPDLHRYVPPPSHPPLHPHPHLHPHTSHMSSPSHLEQLHAHNLASLAAAESSYRSSQGEDLTPTHSHTHSNSTLSSQTPPSTHSIPHHHMRMEPPPMRPMHTHTNGRNFPHPLVMPDAYPRVVIPDVHRYVHEPYEASFSDYGDTSTYASTELDEALHFNYEAEPGFCSLTATDYDDHDDA